MDPNDVLIPESWVNDPDEFPNNLPDGVEKTSKYYAKKVRYADGRDVYTWYKRGTAGPDGNDRVITTQEVVIPKLREDWDKKVKDAQKAQQQQTDQAERQRGDEYRGTFPEGHPKAGQPAMVTEWGDGRKTYKEIDTEVESERRKAASRAEEDQSMQRSREERAVAASERATANQADANRRAWAELALQVQRENRLSEADAAKLRNGERITTSSGRILQIRNDPQTGQAIVDDVTPKTAASGKPLSGFDPETRLGTISQAIQAKLAQVYQDPDLTEQEKYQRAQLYVGAGDALLKEQERIISTQQNIYSNAITQRGQDLSDAASRRSAAQNIWSTSFNNARQSAQFLPAGAGNTAFNSAIGQMLLGFGAVGAAGGMRQAPPQAQPGAALQEVNQMGLSGYKVTMPGGLTIEPAQSAAVDQGIKSQLMPPPQPMQPPIEEEDPMAPAFMTSMFAA